MKKRLNLLFYLFENGHVIFHRKTRKLGINKYINKLGRHGNAEYGEKFLV